MIKRIRIRGYRTFRTLDFSPQPRFNILVGDNGSGKSTLLEALSLVLTGRLNGRSAAEELNPYWFNQRVAAKFFADRAAGAKVAPPQILIEAFLADREEFARLQGANNTLIPATDSPGLALKVVPDPEYASEFEAYVDAGESTLLPVEYYRVDWRSFADQVLTQRPKGLTTAIIDSRTIRSANGVDFHLRQILNDHLEPTEKAKISVAFREVKQRMASTHLTGVNKKIGTLNGALGGEEISLAMDQSARGSWDSSVVPHVADVPFGMSGQGQQAVIKIALAMSQEAAGTGVIMVEEPENHLSHTSLNLLLSRIADLAGEAQQMFVTTHSSYVLNRLGIDALQLISGGAATSLHDLPPETVDYFRKLPGYDTLRMVLARKSVLVEGPSDELLFERFYKDRKGRRPIEDEIDVFSMRGLSLRRFLELAVLLNKQCAVLTDSDGKAPDYIRAGLGDLLGDRRKVFIGAPVDGPTLEPQIIAANDEERLREILGIQARAGLGTWMSNNKTEAALRFVDHADQLTPPPYFIEAIDFISGS